MTPLCVGIDPGHGGSDTGAVSPTTGDQEDRLNLGTAIALRDMLSIDANFKPVLLREHSADITLRQRGRASAKVGCSIVIHIHHNAGHTPVLAGLETYSWPGNETGEHYAQQIARSAPHELCPSRAYAPAPGWASRAKGVMACFRATSVLVECGYLTEPQNSAWLHHPEARHITAAAIYQGILRARLLCA